MAVSYNTTAISVVHMYSTTGGGTTFGSDLKGLATFNYFSTSATVNDCLYVTCGTTMWSDIEFDVGTAISATGLTMVYQELGLIQPLPLQLLTLLIKYQQLLHRLHIPYFYITLQLMMSISPLLLQLLG